MFFFVFCRNYPITFGSKFDWLSSTPLWFWYKAALCTLQIQALLCVRNMLETTTQLETPGVILLSFLYADSVTDQWN